MIKMFYLRDIQTEYVPDALFSKNCLKHAPVPNRILTSIEAKINGSSLDEPTCEKDPWELPKGFYILRKCFNKNNCVIFQWVS